MPTTEKPSAPLAVIATNRIRDRILELSLAPSTQLDETILRDQLGISRTPAREALNRLVAEGLVETRANKGFYVAPLDLQDTARFFDAYCIAEAAIGGLCRFGHPGFVEDLVCTQKEHGKAVSANQFLEITRCNAQFHTRIAEATENKFIIELSRRVHNYSRRLVYLVYQVEADDSKYFEGQQAKVVEEHEAMIDAVRTRDRGRLMEVLTSHSERFRTRITRYVGGLGYAVTENIVGTPAPDPAG
jgi:DNA-binding GntR family transcriptional regulator